MFPYLPHNRLHQALAFGQGDELMDSAQALSVPKDKVENGLKNVPSFGEYAGKKPYRAQIVAVSEGSEDHAMVQRDLGIEGVSVKPSKLKSMPGVTTSESRQLVTRYKHLDVPDGKDYTLDHICKEDLGTGKLDVHEKDGFLSPITTNKKFWDFERTFFARFGDVDQWGKVIVHGVRNWLYRTVQRDVPVNVSIHIDNDDHAISEVITAALTFSGLTRAVDNGSPGAVKASLGWLNHLASFEISKNHESANDPFSFGYVWRQAALALADTVASLHSGPSAWLKQAVKVDSRGCEKHSLKGVINAFEVINAGRFKGSTLNTMAWQGAVFSMFVPIHKGYPDAGWMSCYKEPMVSVTALIAKLIIGKVFRPAGPVTQEMLDVIQSIVEPVLKTENSPFYDDPSLISYLEEMPRPSFGKRLQARLGESDLHDNRIREISKPALSVVSVSRNEDNNILVKLSDGREISFAMGSCLDVLDSLTNITGVPVVNVKGINLHLDVINRRRQ